MVGRFSRVVIRVRGIVAEAWILEQVPNRVGSKTIDAPRQPESHHLVNGIADLGVVPVEIWLLLEKGVVIVLT
jgi:hypothetical protein